MVLIWGVAGYLGICEKKGIDLGMLMCL